ncbi:hypothetical protein DFQ28_011522 [Apophysomyces sp. BC1034]|nr:hypothetical protein DFQ28_011522 [Apophysomyces sp. BC1034]
MLYIFSISTHACQYDLLEYVDLFCGRVLQYIDNQLTVLQDNGRQQTALRMPTSLSEALRNSSSIMFPTTHSKVIDGDEYALMVVNHRSNRHPNNDCSAGEEGVLYALRLRDGIAKPVFSLTIQSCVKDIHLDRSSGRPSRYAGISWTINPVGIQINWSYQEDWIPTTRQFCYCDGEFIPSTSSRCQHQPTPHDPDAAQCTDLAHRHRTNAARPHEAGQNARSGPGAARLRGVAPNLAVSDKPGTIQSNRVRHVRGLLPC